MFTCGFVRSNFSLAMAKLLWPGSGTEGRCAQFKKPGAGRRDRTDILSLEGCCTTIVLYPHEECGCTALRMKSDVSAPDTFIGLRPRALKARGGGSRTRTCEAYAADLQSAPFAARDIPPARLMSMPVWKRRKQSFDHFATKAFAVGRRLQ